MNRRTTTDRARALSDSGVFARRREALLAQMEDGVALVPAARPALRNRDVAHPFRQASDFWYLTGLDEPEGLLVLARGREEGRAVLFVRPRDPERERWEGARVGPEGAVSRLGVDEAFTLADREEQLVALLRPVRRVYMTLGEDRALDRLVVRLLGRFRQQSREPERGPTEVHDLSDLLAELRVYKDAAEVDALRRAARLTAAGIRAAMAAAHPGCTEYELRAAVEYAFAMGGAERTSFESVIASGANATVLHYVGGRRRIEAGDLVLADVGAEVDYLAGDLTRTFPVDGRFTGPQLDVYEIVRAALETATAGCGPGVSYQGLHEAAVRQLTRGLIDLGLLAGEVDGRVEDESYRRYFPHRLGHFVGVDVHDVGRYRDGQGWRPLLPGMAVTIEPGLYVPPDDETAPRALRGVGVRIEDVLLVTEHGAENLSKDLPRAPDEVAALVGTTQRPGKQR